MDAAVTAAGDVLLERDVEVQQLNELLRAADEGRGRGAAVVGPAGIGKTELLQAAQTIARQRGMTCLAARGAELEQDLPYGIARQLFEGPLRTRTPAERRVLFEGAAELAANALGFDEFGRTADAPFGVIHGLYWLCATLAETAPLVLVVDDLHWADESSVRLLAYLMRRVQDLPVLVLVAARPPLDEVQAKRLDAIVADAEVVRLELAALSESATRALVEPLWEEPPTDSFVDALHRATSGNPFLCITLASALSERGVRPDDDTAHDLAELAGKDVSETVLRRLGRLPEPVGDLARALAVVGGATAELRHAAEVAGIAPEDAGRARDLLVEQGVLAEAAGTEFVHPLVRTAIYESMPQARRSQLHGEAARLLAAEDASPETIALHLLVTEPRADPGVVESLRVAARAVMREGEPGAAVAYLRRALREPPPPNERAVLLHELGVAEFRAGTVDAAALSLADALRLETDPRRRTEAGRDLGFALFQTRRFSEGVDVQSRALEEATATDPDLARWLEAERHQSALMDPESYRPVADRLDLESEIRGNTSGERAVLAAGATEGALRIGPGAQRVSEWARRAIDRGLLDDSTSSSSGIWVNAAVPLIFAEDFAAAERAADAMVDDARRRGSPVAAARAYMSRSLLNLRRGSIIDAEADARSPFEVGAEVGFPPSRLAVGVLIEVLVERGELDAADTFLREVGSEADIANQFTDNWILYSRGRLRSAQGRIDEAAADLRELGRRGDDHWRSWNPGIFGYRSELADCYLRSGNRSRATELAEEERRLAELWGAPLAIGIATRTLGRAVGGDRGLDLLASSAKILEGSGGRLEHARALVELGAAIRRAGRPTEAREPLRQGADLADACGAAALTAQALEELRAAGARPRRIARTGVNALTASERRVARLAADGMSNREIAQALFVTLRTVEVHLTHCYQKLGISSRDQLSAQLEPLA